MNDENTTNTLYIPRNPGDLITAEDWNDLQERIQGDIESKVQGGIDGIDSVDEAGNAAKLEGKTVEELTQEILDKALAKIPTRTGYLKIFKELKLKEECVIKHDLKACPLVDIYQLDYFKVVCDVDEEKSEQWVTFYLYHSSERKLKSPIAGGGTIEIEPTKGQPYKIPLAEMLDRYNVQYTEESSLGDLETEFWKAFFADPNDDFDPDQYCHSPWFERCCREERTVKSLKQKGDWDDLWFQVRPRKTINYPFSAENGFDSVFPSPAPTQIGVTHFDFDTLGVTLLQTPVSQKQTIEPPPDTTNEPPFPVPGIDENHLKVMLLLKV